MSEIRTEIHSGFLTQSLPQGTNGRFDVPNEVTMVIKGKKLNPPTLEGIVPDNDLKAAPLPSIISFVDAVEKRNRKHIRAQRPPVELRPAYMRPLRERKPEEIAAKRTRVERRDRLVLAGVAALLFLATVPAADFLIKKFVPQEANPNTEQTVPRDPGGSVNIEEYYRKFQPKP